MERLKSRTKSMMHEARKSIVNEKYKAEPIDPVLAAGGLAPSPAAARAKIAMLPTASSLAEGETLPSIFSSVNATGTPFGEPLHAPSGAMFGRRSTSVSLSPIAQQQHGGPTNAPRSASALDEPSWLSGGGGGGGPSNGAFAHPKYKEHTVEDYHRVMDDFQKIKWGGLGADDTAEKKKARETRQRVLNYGKCVSQLNVQLIKNHQQAVVSPQRGTTDGVIARKLTVEGELARLKRERALKFADQLWMKERKARSPPPVREDHPSVQRAQPSSNAPSQSTIAELKQLEDRHRTDYEKILAIKKQLGIMVMPDGGGRVGASNSSFAGEEEADIVEGAEEAPPSIGSRGGSGSRSQEARAQDDDLPPFLHEEDYAHAQREEAQHAISPGTEEAPHPLAQEQQQQLASTGSIRRQSSVRSRHSAALSATGASEHDVHASADEPVVGERNTSIVEGKEAEEEYVCNHSTQDGSVIPLAASAQPPSQRSSVVEATATNDVASDDDDEARRGAMDEEVEEQNNEEVVAASASGIPSQQENEHDANDSASDAPRGESEEASRGQHNPTTSTSSNDAEAAEQEPTSTTYDDVPSTMNLNDAAVQ